MYSGPIIGAGGFTPNAARDVLAARAPVYDAVAFGRFFISNPDLVERLRTRAPLNVYDRTSFYIRDPVKGYVDYPALADAGAATKASLGGRYPVGKYDVIAQNDVVGATLEQSEGARKAKL